MKSGLFILSVTGAVFTAYGFIKELFNYRGSEDFIYFSLLVILLCLCVLGAIINYPDNFFVKRRFKAVSGKPIKIKGF